MVPSRKVDKKKGDKKVAERKTRGLSVCLFYIQCIGGGWS
jgi:hypothetical protein